MVRKQVLHICLQTFAILINKLWSSGNVVTQRAEHFCLHIDAKKRLQSQGYQDTI